MVSREKLLEERRCPRLQFVAPNGFGWLGEIFPHDIREGFQKVNSWEPKGTWGCPGQEVRIKADGINGL